VAHIKDLIKGDLKKLEMYGVRDNVSTSAKG
jgi:hypothetical protein